MAMDSDYWRARLLQLAARRDLVEAEMAVQARILEENGVGMADSLVDENDFPRNDIDVFQVRHARHIIICLQNDYKGLMKEIEDGLHKLHEIQSNELPVSNGVNGMNPQIALHMNGHDPVAAADFANGTTHRSIVKVNFVSPGSPSESAGILVDDDIIEFGSVNVNNFKALTQIAEVVQHSVNVGVNVKIVRGSNRQIVDVILIPRTWNGRGLLGCNIIIHPDYN